MGLDRADLEAARRRAVEAVLAMRDGVGTWTGRLSGSAVATAVAAGALDAMDANVHGEAIRAGAAWLERTRNEDGGWGDTPQSPSNLAATLLGHFALRRLGRPGPGAAEGWLRRAGAAPSCPEAVAGALVERYGADRTFAVPILTFCALAEQARGSSAFWSVVPRLPFELGLLPHGLLRAVRLPVVSYALPALIAVGQAIHAHRPPAGPAGWLREAVAPAVRRRLAELQPSSGGFLEAPPLTGFVGLCLAAMGRGDEPVARACGAYLRGTQRAEGSWPIDADLGTWVTTQAVRAMAVQPEGLVYWLGGDGAVSVRQALLDRQQRGYHVYTAARAGGWSWTPRPGGVPDADDTAGAIRTLCELGADGEAGRAALRRGAGWLGGLQNADGGWPTFCRGWGHLPFDRSCADITAHVVEALSSCVVREDDARRVVRLREAVCRGLGYLRRVQGADGSFLPLWFGNEQDPEHRNGTYGTGRVVLATAGMRRGHVTSDRAVGWLLAARGAGGWGALPGSRPTIEETALAVEALSGAWAEGLRRPGLREAIEAGCGALLELTQGGREFPPSPIGLYFSRLAYAEEAYPAVFTVAALGRAVAVVG